MNICFNALKIKHVLFEWALMVFTIFTVFLRRKSKKVSACFYEITTNCANSFSNPLQVLWAGDFDHENWPACGLKYHTGSHIGHEHRTITRIFPASNEGWRLENWPMTEREACTEINNNDAASGTIFIISKCLQKSIQKLLYSFLLYKAS